MQGRKNPGIIIVAQIIGKNKSKINKKTNWKQGFWVCFDESSSFTKIINPKKSPLIKPIDSAKNRKKVNINGKRKRISRALKIEQQTNDIPYLSGIRC